MTAAEIPEAHLPQLSRPVKLQRLKPQNCDSNWSCKFDGEETAKLQVVGWYELYENTVNTVEHAGAAKKV